MKVELIALLKEFKEIFALSFQDMLGLDTKKLECPLSVASPLKYEVRDYPKNQRRSRKVVES